jgi:carboxypeptidase Q
MALAAVRLLEELDLVPQRTLRVVLYTAEEIGGYGGRAYRSAHANEVAHHVAALECDSGAFPPRGFSLRGTEAALAYLQQLATGLAPLGPLEIVAGGAGVDINPLVTAGVPGIGLRVDGSDYFAYHHSPADTFDKIDPEQLARNVAAVAALIYAVAEADEPLPRQAADEARSTSE